MTTPNTVPKNMDLLEIPANRTAAAVPEPSIAGLFGIGGLTMLLRRRR